MSLRKWANNLWKKNQYTGAVAYDYDNAIPNQPRQVRHYRYCFKHDMMCEVHAGVEGEWKMFAGLEIPDVGVQVIEDSNLEQHVEEGECPICTKGDYNE